MSAAFPADVGVTIVCHNNRESLAATLASLDRAGCPHARRLIVDIVSTDGTVEWLRDAYPEVRVRTLEWNEGPNPGRNTGIRDTPERFVFLMDADVRVLPDTIGRLRRAMTEDPAARIATPLVVHDSDACTIQYGGGHLHFMCEAINRWAGRSLAERGTANAEVGVASANALLIDRAAAMEVGLFDERYFMGKDDGDFTHRMRVAGHRIVEVAEALVLHRSRPRSDWLFYYQLRNRWHFMLKNYQWRTLVAILPCLAIHEPLQLVVLHAAGHGRTYWKAVRGLIAMLPDLRRDRASVGRIRRVPDGALLRSDRLVVRDDLMRNPIVRVGKAAYEGFLSAYWRLLRRTVLAG